MEIEPGNKYVQPFEFRINVEKVITVREYIIIVMSITIKNKFQKLYFILFYYDIRKKIV